MISEAKGFGYKNRHPAGRSLVEGRNNDYKLTIWAQDLKPQTLYSVFLLFSADKRYAGVPMGRLIIDEKGKGEIRKEFDDTALGEFSLPDFVAVAIITRDSHGVSSPLCGYKDSPVSWRHGFYEYSIAEKRPAQESVIKAEAQESAAKSEEDPPTPVSHSAAEENVPTPISHSTIEPSAAEALTEPPLAPSPPPQEELPILELHALVSPDMAQSEDIQTIPVDIHNIPEGTHSILEDTPPSPEPLPHEKPSTSWNLPQSDVAKAFRTALDKLHTDTIQSTADCEPTPSILSLFETREFITPFQKQARKADWISFTPSDPVPPPTNKPQLFQDPFIQSALAEYHHLILGLTTDQGPRRYIIGVPGVYSQESKQKAKRLGFTQFKCTRDAMPSWGEAGYWLMFTTVC